MVKLLHNSYRIKGQRSPERGREGEREGERERERERGREREGERERECVVSVQVRTIDYVVMPDIIY